MRRMSRPLFATCLIAGLAAAPALKAQVIFSDGFDSGDARRWTATASAEPITYPREGCREGRSPCGAMTLRANVVQQSVLWGKGLNHGGPQFYTGAWYRFPAGYSWNAAPGWVDPETGQPRSTEHKMFIINVGDNVGRVLVNLRGNGNSPTLQTHFERLEGRGGISKFSQTRWPTDGGWHHLEVLIDRVSGTNGRARIWLDGNPVLDERGAVCGSPCSPVVDVAIGAFVNQGADRRETFLVDDVVLAGSLPPTTSVRPPGGGGDVTPPTVSMQAPRNGDTVSGAQVQLQANAQDNRAVAGVQFRLDGLNLGAERTAAPYSLAWDTTQVANGSHTLDAVARDTAGLRTTSSPVTVTVNNSAPTRPPGTVNDLRVSRTGSRSVDLTFTETNDGANQPAKYEVRQQEGGETLNWGSAQHVTLGSCATPLAGRAIGRVTTCTVDGLKPATRYHFQILPFRGTLDSTSDPAVFGGFSRVVSTTTGAAAQALVDESFEDDDFSDWYDDTRLVTTTAQHIPGSQRAAQFRFARGEQQPGRRGAIRHEFTETDSVYLRYYVKYSDNWIGSGQAFHPHQFHFLSNREGRWSPLSANWLNVYVEANGGTPQIQIQDAKNIDQSRIGADLTRITEQRAVGGCNGDADGHGAGDCYGPAGQKVNGKLWRAPQVWFTNERGPRYKGDWHKVEAYIKLNSIVGGRGVADGVIRYFYDDQAVINVNNAMLRTGANAGLKFKELVIAPYIAGEGERGSPVDQTFWVDDLSVATAPPAESAAAR